jgi:hypothetical protein
MYSQQSTQDQELGLPWIAETVTTETTESAEIEIEVNPEVTVIHTSATESIEEETIEVINHNPQEEGFLGVPQSISQSGSADTLVPSAPTSPSNLSNVTLVGSTGSGGDKLDDIDTPFRYGIAPTSTLPERVIPKRPPRTIEQQAAIIASESIMTICKSQQLPQTTTTIKSSISETRPSIIKIASPPALVTALTTNIVTITSSTLLTTTSASASTTTKTSITTPSIGVSFDR